MSRLEELTRQPGRAAWQRPSRIIMVLLTGFVAWSAFAQIDEVSFAAGSVVPEGKVRVIQHLEGGIIREIHVQEGQTVEAGGPLVQLDLPVGGINREELQVRLDGLLLARARLAGEAEGVAPVFPPEAAARRPQLLAAEQNNHRARMEGLESALRVLQEQVRQREMEVQELLARERAVNSNLRLVRQKLAMSRDLVKDGLVSKMDHVQLESEADALEGQMSVFGPAIPRARAALAEMEGRIEEERARFRSEAQAQLTATEVEVARVEELLSIATGQKQRALITSPTAGIVKNMRYHTIGGVVRAGEPIMEIVPLDERLLVEAKLSPSDRGYVREGQPARVKVSAYDFTRYGALDGTVLLVAPDATSGSEGEQYFRVLVETEKAYLGTADAPLAIVPGMQTVVDIKTGTRSVARYFLRPVIKLKDEAFRER